MSSLTFVAFESMKKNNGVSIKVKEQVEALNTLYPVTVYFRKYYKNYFFKLIVNRIFYEFRYICHLLFSKKSIIYYRYFYGAIFFNFFLCFHKKHTLYLEFNANNEKEAKMANKKLRIVKNIFFEKRLAVRANKIISYAYPISPSLNNFTNDKLKLILNGRVNIPCKGVPSKEYEIVNVFKSQFDYLAVFVGHFFPWQGIDRIIEITKKTHNLGLVIVGNGDKEIEEMIQKNISTMNNILWLGKLEQKIIKAIYEQCNFGFGSFAIDRQDLKVASPLKVSEYLVNGLPTVINFDIVTTITNDYIYNYKNNEDFTEWLKKIKYFDKNKICEYAYLEFNWINIFNNIFN